MFNFAYGRVSTCVPTPWHHRAEPKCCPPGPREQNEHLFEEQQTGHTTTSKDYMHMFSVDFMLNFDFVLRNFDYFNYVKSNSKSKLQFLNISSYIENK